MVILALYCDPQAVLSCTATRRRLRVILRPTGDSMLHCDPQAAFSVSLKCTPHIEKQDIDSALYDRSKRSRYGNNALATL